jgi:hypothetical protein
MTLSVARSVLRLGVAAESKMHPDFGRFNCPRAAKSNANLL